MSSSSRQSATFSIGSDSSSVYSEDDYKSDTNLIAIPNHHPSHLQPNIGGLRCENAQKFEGTSAVSFSGNLTTPNLDEDGDSSRDTSSSYTAAYRFETLEEAEERRHRSAAGARPGQYDIRRDITLDEPKTYMQRVLAEHDAASARENSDQYRFEDEDIEEPITRPTVPARRHLRVISADAIPSRHMRTTLLLTTSFASTNPGEVMEEFARESGAYRHMLQEENAGDTFAPVTPRPRAKSLSSSPSELWLVNSSSCALDRQAQQSAALSGLDGANEESDKLLPPESSGQWLGGTARHLSLAARRQGRVDWQKSGLYSSAGRQYGLGNREKGYVAGDYVTSIRDDARPEKEKRKRDAWKRISCF